MCPLNSKSWGKEISLYLISIRNEGTDTQKNKKIISSPISEKAHWKDYVMVTDQKIFIWILLPVFCILVKVHFDE